MTLAPFVQTLGRGPGRARALTRAEAEEAMHVMLSGNADPEAVGAILMLLRMKGETAAEIAGFAASAQRCVAEMPAADLDWPSYAAGRTRGMPWFLLAAKLVARSGRRVVLHGWNGADASVRSGVKELGIVSATNTDDAVRELQTSNIVYAPLEVIQPKLFELLRLRDILGLRSCVNTVARMLNPGCAPASVQGVFHPSYRLLQADAAQALGWQSLSVIKGGGGEFERHPGKSVAAFGLRGAQAWQMTVPALTNDARRLTDGPISPGALSRLWEGRFHDEFATAMVLGTAELAFGTLGVAEPRALTERLWADRLAPLAA